MALCAYAAVPAHPFQSVGAPEAASVTGGACTGQGVAISYCGWSPHILWNNGKNGGYAVGGGGPQQGITNLYCPCDSTVPPQQSAGGTCTSS